MQVKKGGICQDSNPFLAREHAIIMVGNDDVERSFIHVEKLKCTD